MIKKTDYISMVTHEIRNPLTLVYSTLQLIESKHPEVKQYEHWADLHHDINYMIKLLEELSSYNNSSRLHLKTIDSSYFFRKLALSFASAVTEQKTEFISRIESDLPFICCDDVKLREVLLNLLFNARDAVSEACNNHTCENPFIRMNVSAVSDHLQIIIEDNGCGIPEEHLNNIFEPFVTYKKNGTGLGLAITSSIIQSHKGTIRVSSVPGSGTAFTLTLPVKQDT